MHHVNSRLTNYLNVFSFLKKAMNDRTNQSKGYEISLIGFIEIEREIEIIYKLVKLNFLIPNRETFNK